MPTAHYLLIFCRAFPTCPLPFGFVGPLLPRDSDVKVHVYKGLQAATVAVG
ncbi:unnamed protein product [Meloidogyne enterolobii]|uniref:Uncharacterized protein n=1 Tax=Meloidogyne enterolobii TaxID=390850 RepID=A0ACB1A450_MELEN